MMELLKPGGWCAQLTANSFMKREFGRKYVETYLPGYDMPWVIDTSGAYIPGHGTPTIIHVTRNQPPASDQVMAIQSVRGEPTQPSLDARGIVWGQIRRAVRERDLAARFEAVMVAAHSPQPPEAPAERPSASPRAVPAESPKRRSKHPADQLGLFEGEPA